MQRLLTPWIKVASPVAERLGIPVEMVNVDMLWEYDSGSCIEGAGCVWPLWPFDECARLTAIARIKETLDAAKGESNVPVA